MGAADNRTDERFRVHLTVRYERAVDFVLEYAENLSAGGLFIRGAKDLTMLEHIKVKIELPGYGEFEVTAEVAHLVDEATAAATGRTAGAGLALVNPDKEFTRALNAYLLRLGRRADVMVLVGHPPYEAMIEGCGYQVMAAPEPQGLANVISKSKAPVIGIVVPSTKRDAYEAAARVGGVSAIVFTLDRPEDLDGVLSSLDEELWNV